VFGGILQGIVCSLGKNVAQLACLAADKDLEQLRFGLVPRKLKEDKFWRNYFYHVSLLKAAYVEEDGPPSAPQDLTSPDTPAHAGVLEDDAGQVEAEENQRLRTEALLAQMDAELQPDPPIVAAVAPMTPRESDPEPELDAELPELEPEPEELEEPEKPEPEPEPEPIVDVVDWEKEIDDL
jgi:hypothetical protein